MNQPNRFSWQFFPLILVLSLLQVSAQPVVPSGEQDMAAIHVLAWGGVVPTEGQRRGEQQAVAQTAVSLPHDLAFSSNRGDEFNVYQQTAAGETAVKLIDNAINPSWAPDGSQLLFARFENGNYEVYLRDATGAEHNLSNHSSNDLHPTWHPDGQAILFASDRAGGFFQIYQMNVEGGDVVRLANVANNHTLFPQMSPDGSQISYMQASILDLLCTWNWNVWIMNANGSNPQPVTTYLGADIFPTWTPDGREIVYASCTLSYDLYQRIPGTGGDIRLTNTTLANEWLGVYTPTGDKIAYVSDEPGNSEIFMQSSGEGASDVVNVTQSGENDTWPSWRSQAPAGSLIRGRVTAFGDAPLAGVVVDNGAGQEVKTNQDGAFFFTDLPNGRYTLTPRHESYQFDPPSLTLTVPPDASNQLFVGKDCTGAKKQTPVLLVTGWSGSERDRLYKDGQLKHMMAALDEAGYVEGCTLFYAAGTTPSVNIAENGRIIRDTLCRFAADAKAYNSSWDGDFNILAHSYGGLRARGYLENASLYGSACPESSVTISVRNLITMGTPHGGGLPNLPFAAFIGASSILRGDEWPAIFEMLPPIRLAQNFVSSQPEDVCYYLLGGDARGQWPVFLSAAALYYFTGYGASVLAEPNDLALTRDSAHQLTHPIFSNSYRRTTPLDTPDLHGHIPDSEEFITLRSFVRPRDTFDQIIKQLLTDDAACTTSVRSQASKTAVSQARWQAIEALEQATTQPALPLLDVAAGVLATGETAAGTFELTSEGQTGLTLHWTAGEMVLTLVDPSGREIKPTTAVSDGTITYTELNGGLGWLASYTLETAQAGTWRYRIDATGSETAVYRLVLLPATPIGTSVAVPDWLPHGSMVPITAAVTFDNSTPVTGSRVIANVTRPDGSRHSLTLLDDGQSGDGAANDGVYGGHFGPALQGGTYGVLLEADGMHDDEAFARSATAVFTIAPPKAALTGSYNDYGVRGGEYFQALAVAMGVAVSEASRFTLTAELYAGDLFVTQTAVHAFLTPADQTVTLHFDGQAIRDSGLDGPYTVRHLILLDNEPLSLLIERVEVGGETAVYTHDQFGRLWRNYLPTLPKQ